MRPVKIVVVGLRYGVTRIKEIVLTVDQNGRKKNMLLHV
jgi:hypothetical protein